MSLNSKADIVALAIRQVARDYYRSTKPDATAIAAITKPVANSNSASFEYNFFDGHIGRLAGPLPELTTETSSLPASEVGIDSKIVRVKAWGVGEFDISDSTLDAFDATLDRRLESVVIDGFMNRAYTFHSVATRNAALAGLNIEQADLNSDLDQHIAECIRQIQLSSSVRPDAIYLGEELVDLIGQQDFIFRGAGNSEAVASDRRVGYATDQDVADYFMRRHRLQLFVDKAQWAPDATPGTPDEFVFGQHAIIGRAGDEFGLSTLRTFVQYEADTQGLLRTEIRRNSAGRLGSNIGAEAYFSVEAVAPETGLVLDFGSGYSS